MHALGFFAYLLGCFFIAIVLTVVVALFRSVKEHDKFRSWRWTIFFTILVGAAPYGYAEVLTQLHGQEMTKAVEKSLKAAQINGKLHYFKVLKQQHGSAQVLVVAKEKTTLNDHESAIMKVFLTQDSKGKWKPEKYEFIDSFKRNKDSVSFPPYW
ncbi:MAG: hypothetical protein R2688_09765 [Fimbriimonadaceae bacterium]